MVLSSSNEERDALTTVNYTTTWPAYGLSWAGRSSPEVPLRLVISSYLLDYKNLVEIVELDSNGECSRTHTYNHCYPPTKVMFPPKPLAHSDVFITTAESLRLWTVNHDAGNNSSGEAVVFKKSRSGFCTPITSCDWNADDTNMVGCCSVDKVVTIWDLEAKKPKKQVKTNEKEVFDVAFNTAHTFATCSADGSVRLFDLRQLEHSSILYDSPKLTVPLLRIAWNRQDLNFISTFGMDTTETMIIDVRYPSSPVTELKGRHTGPVNAMAWSPQSAQNICTVGEDGLVCIWDAHSGESLFQYNYSGQINNVAWSGFEKDWIAITTNSGAQLLRF